MDVQIYSTPTCGYCLNAKNWFNEHGIEFTEHSLINEEEKLEFFQRVNNVEEKIGNKASSIMSVPQIFVNGERIGGYAQLLTSLTKHTNLSIILGQLILFKNMKKFIGLKMRLTYPKM